MAQPYDLVSLAELKVWLNVQTTTDDAMLQTLIDQASQWVNNYTNRILYTGSYSVTLDGKGEVRKYLQNWPITAVASLTIDGTTIPASPDGIQSGYVFDKVNPVISLIGGYMFNPGTSNVLLTYTAGYATFPPEIVLAAKQLITAWYRGRSWAGKNSSGGLQGQSASYFNKAEAPPEVLRCLDSYRRIFPW